MRRPPPDAAATSGARVPGADRPTSRWPRSGSGPAPRAEPPRWQTISSSSHPSLTVPDPLQRLAEIVGPLDQRPTTGRAVVLRGVGPAEILDRAGELLKHHPSTRPSDPFQHGAQLSAQSLFELCHCPPTCPACLPAIRRASASPIGPWFICLDLS